MGKAVSFIGELLVACLLLSAPAAAEWSLQSPNGKLTVAVSCDERAGLSYRVDVEGECIIKPSPLGITVEGGQGGFDRDIELVDERDAAIDETYALSTGKRRDCRSRANEKVLVFRNRGAEEMELVLRAYDDGMAYRYRLPGQGQRRITAESSAFVLPEGATGWLSKYVRNYESVFDQGVVGKDFSSGHYCFPALFEAGERKWVLLCEAALGGRYCGCRLRGEGKGLFRVVADEKKMDAELPWETPWREAIIGSLAQIVESTLLESLNPACPAEDVAWIVPGRVAWSWWSASASPGDLDVQKQYVDFAGEMGWQYVLVDEGWKRHDWAPDLVKYAAPKGVGILLWVHWTDLKTEEKRKRLLPLWKSWGVKGVKVDFMDSDSIERMRFYEAISRAAFENRLMLNFHGATAPRGERRRWPHIMTREGVLGAEYYKWTFMPNSKHNCTLPFTRNVIGSMDYTPVTFSARTRKTTAAHELALSVVFESGWQHFADSIATYGLAEFANSKDILRRVPAAWDETKLIAGRPGDFVCLARRKGNEWFVGAINADQERHISVPLSFIGKESHVAQIYRDGPSDTIAVAQHEVKATSALKLKLPPNGGLCMRLAPEEDGNPGPLVMMTAPKAGQDYKAPATIELEAEASDANGLVTEVEFFEGSDRNPLGSGDIAPYKATMRDLPPGRYALFARAKDDEGGLGTSAPIRVEVTGEPLPQEWKSVDLGMVGMKGSACFWRDAFFLEGSGRDAWDKTDSFHWAHRPVEGDAQIVARVRNIRNTDQWAKAGVTIRKDVGIASRHVMVVLTPGNGVCFLWRPAAGTGMKHVSHRGVGVPCWLKLCRKGNVFSGFHSRNGADWTPLAEQKIDMAAGAYAGLLVTSYNNKVLSRTAMDNVRLHQGKDGLPK